MELFNVQNHIWIYYIHLVIKDIEYMTQTRCGVIIADDNQDAEYRVKKKYSINENWEITDLKLSAMIDNIQEVM